MEAQWRRLVIPVTYHEQSLTIQLQSYAHHATTVYVHQVGNSLKQFDIPASNQLAFSHSLEYQPNGDAPVTVFFYGAADNRIWIDAPSLSSIWHGALIGIGVTLAILNLILAASIRRPQGLGLAMFGPILLLLPLLSAELAWLTLFMYTLLHLPRNYHRTLPWVLPLGIIPLWLNSNWLSALPLVLCPVLLILALRPSKDHIRWAYQIQLLCLLILCLERFPVPTLDPVVLMLPCLGFLLANQLEQLCWLLTRGHHQTKPSSNSQQPANNRQQQQRRLGDLQGKINSLERENRLLEEKSTTDPLTGLRNRQFFNEHYRVEVARSMREGRPVSLLIIDLDHFKAINDTHGHPVGDHVLQQVSKRAYFTLRRPADTLCRYGGEEFVILLPDTGENGAIHIAETLLHQIRKDPIVCGDLSLSVTASIGVATVIQHAKMTDTELLRRADQALYQAKDAGRNRYCQAERQRELEAHLAEALSS